MQRVAKWREAAGQEKVVGGSEKPSLLACWVCLLPHTVQKYYYYVFVTTLLINGCPGCLKINLRVSGRE